MKEPAERSAFPQSNVRPPHNQIQRSKTDEMSSTCLFWDTTAEQQKKTNCQEKGSPYRRFHRIEHGKPEAA